jgi:hypothetical protein
MRGNSRVVGDSIDETSIGVAQHLPEASNIGGSNFDVLIATRMDIGVLRMESHQYDLGKPMMKNTPKQE